MWGDGILRILSTAGDSLLCASAVAKLDSEIGLCPRCAPAALTFNLSNKTTTDCCCPWFVIKDRAKRLGSREALDKLQSLLPLDLKQSTAASTETDERIQGLIRDIVVEGEGMVDGFGHFLYGI
jgi:hypothetical protein